MREKLSNNFYRDEFECQGKNCCGGSAPISDLLVHVLQDARDKMGRRLVVNSGFRCFKHNRSIGSKDTSQHPRGTAADIALVPGMTVDKMAEFFQESLLEVMDYSEWEDCGGLGLYDWGVHVDVRDARPARWDNRG